MSLSTSTNPPEFPVRDAASSSHSKAFESFVTQEDDIVGLLAYSLYKKNINHRKAAGKPILAPDQRDPEGTEVDAYRGRSEALLRVFASVAIENERAQILKEGISESLEKLRNELKRSTGFWWPGVVVGVTAWLISIILTIIVALSAPDWVASLVHLITKK